ncbi:beta galactosidase jelly roll domain-containing protein [Fulvivirga lutea]|uniref:Beta galactosidase jelly roll domain-containing protein n=1 Tax=Fulvivirga lutea TaxID=2810512 RepID=A0A975A097_9BACT|nr:beta galactosidase jelly roll domain-containing protein [Fulvivirga lutea]QSE97011.1 beta galactosidase jelly roll domain-containing protein [Fulvivirga lutea]
MLPQLSNGQLIDLNGRWKFALGDQGNWSSKDFDDSGWESIRVPSPWENQGFHGYDGFAWYRIKFDGSSLPKGVNLFLNMGYVDDADEVYLNGQLIGFSGSMPPNYQSAYNTERKYIIPQNLINYTGENTIAVRVFDATLGGGIMDGKIGIYRVSAGSPILLDLRGIWDFSISESGAKPADNAHWDKINVPSFWEKEGFRRYDGYAWYRKYFDFTPDLENEQLLLILGKIDDFDEVYVNGKLVGRTRDNRHFPHSKSYSEYRIYYLPSTILNKNEPNLIEVQVEDIGLDGGIYEGPIGITTKDRLYRLINK